MKESRLFKMIYCLLSRGRTTAPELAEAFEVSVRTIYRDIDALSEAGIPIYTETGRNGGITILENFVFDKMLFSETERKNILSNLQSLSVIENIKQKDVLTKLSALFHMPAENWFEVDFSRWGTGEKDKNKFELLKDAVINHRTVSVIYVNSCGEKSKRKINPLKFLYKAKAWYIKAYWIEKQSFRTFKFNRILELEVTDSVFRPTAFPDTNEAPPQRYQTICLRFPKEMAYRIYDEFQTCQIEEKGDESLIVTAEMPADAWLVGYILSFGVNAEVIEPIELRKIIANEAKKIYEMNKS